MSEINDSRLLAEMRVMAAKARGEAQTLSNGESVMQDFAGLLKNALNNVNDMQQDSVDLKKRFTAGNPPVSLIDTMVASQKSGLAFEATLQVRNKLLQAYQDIMNMPV